MLELRATKQGDGKKRLEGYAALYETLSNPIPARDSSGTFREKIRRGAFDGVLDQPDTILTLNHNENFVLGRVGSGTLKLSTDQRGLKFSCVLPNTSYANDLYESVKRGDASGCSFAFHGGEDVDDTWDEGRESVGGAIKRFLMRVINRFRSLVDVSVLTTAPAYPGTSVSARSLAACTEFRNRYQATRAPIAPEDWRTASPAKRLDMMVARGHKRSDYELHPSGEFGIVYAGPGPEESERRERILRITMSLPNLLLVDGEGLAAAYVEARKLAATWQLSKAQERRFAWLVDMITKMKSSARSLESLELEYRNAQLRRLGEPLDEEPPVRPEWRWDRRASQ